MFSIDSEYSRPGDWYIRPSNPSAPLSNVKQVDLDKFHEGTIDLTCSSETWVAALKWLDSELRTTALLAGPTISDAERIAALKWLDAELPKTYVPIQIVRTERQHCRYHLDSFDETAERTILASSPIPAAPEMCLTEPGALKFWTDQCHANERALIQTVKRTIREWPICSVTGDPVRLQLDDDGDVVIAFWNCSCGAEPTP